MYQKTIRPLIVTAFAGLAISGGEVSGDVLLANGKPDPSYSNSALQVWLRADVGVAVRGGGLVSLWKDQSLHGHHATQSDVDDQPRQVASSLNGKAVIRFAGSGDHLKFATGFGDTFDGSFTIFAVVAPDDGDPDRDDVWFGLVENSSDNRVILATDGNNDGFAALYKADGNSDNTKVVPNPFPDGPPLGLTLISWVVRAGGTHEVFINGHPQAAAASKGDADNSRFTSGTRTAYLGSAQDSNGALFPSSATSFAGGISEFLLYDGALSSTEREAVEDYLLQGLESISAPIRISSATQLFVDDHLIETTAGLRQTVHQWKRHPDNPVLRPDQPWEFGGKYISTHGSVIYDQEEQLFKAWYWTLNDEDSPVPTSQIKTMCYATSPDGIHWLKPNIGKFKFQGSTANNIVMASAREKIKSLPTLFTYGAIKTPWDPDKNRLYKACFYERPPGAAYMSESDGVWSATSPDGIRWSKSKTLIMPKMGDTVGFFFDSIHQRYVCFGKRYTDRGRSRLQCESDDFVHWTKPRLILKTDDRDDQPCDLYNNTGFVWGEMLLGWLQVFYKHEDPYKHRLVLELIHSRDGLNWTRMPRREPVLDVGPNGSWDRTNQSPAMGSPIVVGDRMYMYYSGEIKYHGPYKGGRLGEVHGQIGLGTLRRDGFVSLDATPRGGVLTTKALQWESVVKPAAAVQLVVNIKSDNGHCRIELLDQAGGPIAGYSKEDAADLVTDSVKAVVAWNGKTDIRQFLRKPIRLRIHLQNARLYSIRLTTRARAE
ncbi:MAG: hypothetical protein VX346_21910 [Planctomycetota bacterium]|nr:hypothetical protein [Planctomycetota bacterium]